jgi:hypothetical protein
VRDNTADPEHRDDLSGSGVLGCFGALWLLLGCFGALWLLWCSLAAALHIRPPMANSATSARVTRQFVFSRSSPVSIYEGSRYQVPGTQFGKILEWAFLGPPIQGGLHSLLSQQRVHVKISDVNVHFFVGMCLWLGRTELGGQGVCTWTLRLHLQGGIKWGKWGRAPNHHLAGVSQHHPRFDRLVPTQMVHAKITRSVIYRRNPFWLGVRESLSTRSIPLLREEECGQRHGFLRVQHCVKVKAWCAGIAFHTLYPIAERRRMWSETWLSPCSTLCKSKAMGRGGGLREPQFVVSLCVGWNTPANVRCQEL